MKARMISAHLILGILGIGGFSADLVDLPEPCQLKH
jgi:hypothetical protein